MSAYRNLPGFIGAAICGLDDAISTHERHCGSGYTVVVVPSSPREPIFVSIDGKPTSVDPSTALALALSLRGEAEGR